MVDGGDQWWMVNGQWMMVDVLVLDAKKDGVGVPKSCSIPFPEIQGQRGKRKSVEMRR